MKSLLQTLNVIMLVVMPLVIFWCIGAVYYTLFDSCSILPALLCGILFFFFWFLSLFYRRAMLYLLFAVAGVIGYFVQLTPQDRFASVRWQAPWLNRPEAVRQADGRILFRNVRDFCYKSEDKYLVRYKDVIVDPAMAESIDLAISHWDDQEAVAHTMLRFNFKNAEPLVLSMETRIPEGKTQNAVSGLFKQYEIIPVVGTPEDLFDLRTKFRGEDFYLYRTCATPEQTRQTLWALFDRLNRPAEFYNTLTSNCTTTLAEFADAVGIDPLEDFRVLINGYSDQLMFELGFLQHREGESFASLKNRCYIRGKSSGIGTL